MDNEMNSTAINSTGVSFFLYGENETSSSPERSYFVTVTSLILAIIGIIGNSLTIYVIMRTKALKQRLANLFIVNQSSIDFLSCVFLFLTMLPLTSIKSYNGLVGWLACCLWSSNAFVWSLVFSSTYSLIALTLERYLSVVHPVWHKLFFSTGKALIIMALTWAAGMIEGLAHSIPTSIIIDGVCYNFYNWPNQSIQKMAGLVTVTLHYILPMFVLIYCYSKMFCAISGRIVKIDPSVAKENPQVAESSMATAVKENESFRHQQGQRQGHYQSTSLGYNSSKGVKLVPTDELSTNGISEIKGSDNEIKQSSNQYQEGETSQASAKTNPPNNRKPIKKKSMKDMIWTRARRNVIHTLAIVSMFFVICWSTNQVYYLMMTLGFPPDYSSTFYHLTVMAIHLNASINPFIYLFRYEVFKKEALKLLKIHPRPNQSE